MSYKDLLLDPSIVGSESLNPLFDAFDIKTDSKVRSKTEMILPHLAQKTFKEISSNDVTGKKLAYIHIPFCKKHCTYCGFFQNKTRKEFVDQYVDALVKEINLFSNNNAVQSGPFHAIYFGGGTPTELEPEHIKRICDALKANLPFANDYEMTFESRFNGFTDEKYRACIEGGFNRFSFGVQSFNTEVRKTLQRFDTGEYCFEKIQELVKKDEASIVFDLMYGLPYQNLELFEQDVEKFVTSGAHGVDLYQLIVFQGGLMDKMIEREKLPNPTSTKEKAIMFKRGVEILDKHKVSRVSTNHWARNTRERNFYNSYTKAGATIVPFGCGAGGFINGHSIMNHRDLNKYFESIEKNEKPIMFLGKSLENMNLNNTLKKFFDIGQISVSEFISPMNSKESEVMMMLTEKWEKNGLLSKDGLYFNLTLAGEFWNVNMGQGAQKLLLSL